MTDIVTTITSAGASMGVITITTDAGGVSVTGTDGSIKVEQTQAGTIAFDVTSSEGAVSIEGFAVGPRGPAGDNGSVIYEQTAPSASWVIANPFGRIPSVEVFLGNGESVLTDVIADSSSINVVFAQAQTGWVILS